jgi:diguanylate cyclase (GGDEF)-like protein/PAS domain S-box-containing protein
MTDSLREQPAESLDLLIPHLRDVVFRTRGKAYWSYLSPAWETLTGYSVAESLGRSILDFVHPDDLKENTSQKERLESGESHASRHVKRLVHRDGSAVWVEVDLRTLYDESGEFIGSVGTLRDIADRVQMQETLDKERQIARTTLAALSDGVMTLDADRRVEFMNAAALELTGVTEAEGLGRLVDTVLFLEGGDLAETIRDSIRSHAVRLLSGRCRVRQPTGLLIDVDLSVFPLDGAERGCVIVLRDVREQRALQSMLSYQAHHDALTQISNRLSMQDDLARVHAASVRLKIPYTVVLGDVDHFKVVNDLYGHALGDEALIRVSKAIRATLRPDDKLARWGGEEFLCLLPNTGPEEGARIAERLRSVVEQIDLDHQGHRVALTMSFGVSSLWDADSVKDLLLRADAALYEAKQAGRNRVWREGQAGSGVIEMAGRVQYALQAGLVSFAQQPIVELATGAYTGFEAFARIHDKTGREFDAASFISVARQLHLVHQIDRCLFSCLIQRCLDAHTRTLEVEDTAPPTIEPISPLCFLNMSADFLRRPELIHELLGKLQFDANESAQGVPLVIELNEREFFQDAVSAKRLLAPFLDLGIELAIDHFGSGAASFDYLVEFPVRYVKFEGALLEKALQNPRARTFIQGMRQTAEEMGCRTVAARVECEQTAALALDMGIDWAQGYYFGHPVSAVLCE